ncbi:pescadillo homolog isoform X2 [Phragmites australis]|uniref:pescadillo homolog isoform X1 n=1 Tax=Phragmites australis TaxID=29695 RepID=UPI002D7854BE|nr:pescadillo homolog isoform X1 [Phragmites australis]XP_062214884.1 pescadillo homolog isoform X2 [Phragmites australis]
MPKHYRPPGKKKEGNAAKYITRTKAVNYLQISLATFRKLCILKGVFPRQPKKKVEGNHKTYYHMKDIVFLLHDPLIEKFREIKVHRKKVKKAVAKKNKDLADRLLNRPPTYKLDRLILERYPTFVDALRDLDDCLTMVHLFAALPAVDGERVEVKRIHNCRRLSHEWQAYISRTHSLRKTFISVKGIYYQAEVQGQKITWLTPHALQQVLTDDVDFNVMLTFLEFYETLLGFANFKLYHSINVNYPPILDSRLEALAAELYALCRYMYAGSGRVIGNSESGRLIEEKVDENSKASSKADESELRLAQLQHQLPTNEPGALMHLVEESTAVDADDNETKECKSLFKNLKFYLSREVPRESLLFIIPAFGGTVSWEGEGAPFNEVDEDITHQIVDRPTQSHVFLSRQYVQPQWIYDCVNARIILPTEGYFVGRVPPPHLSPFVDNDAEGYIPEYAETINRLQAAARNEVLPLPGIGDEDLDNSLVAAIIDRTESNEAAEKKRKLDMLEKQYHDELKMEYEGITFSNLSNKRADNSPDAMDKDDTQSDHVDANKQAEKDAADISKALMSRKTRGLVKAIEIGKERKKDKVELLKKRKKDADSGASAKRR